MSKGIRSKNIALDAPCLGENEKMYLNKAIDTGYVSTAGPFISDFERKFAAYLHKESAVSTQSGTAALHMALVTLGVGPGDEVIVPALTYVATVNPVHYVGATPVFVDADPTTWCMSIEALAQKIGPKTKAIVPVHLYGNMCAMKEIMALAQKHNLIVIEDATESLGALLAGKPSGTWGDMGCFSFNGNKMITTGGGGMVVGQDSAKVENVHYLVNQARNPEDDTHHTGVGYNYRMTNLEAALGLAQLTRLDEFLDKKKTIRRIYEEEFSTVGEITLQQTTPQAISADWMVCAQFKSANLTHLIKTLSDKGIPVRRIFRPLVDFVHYDSCNKAEFKESFKIYENGLCLPSSVNNTEEDIAYVCSVIKESI